MEMARRVASELPRRPEWLAMARENLARWSELNKEAPRLLRGYQEWQALLDRPVNEICTILTDPSDNGQRLRQNSPFAGALTPQEVWEIKNRLRHDQNAA